ncbi:MAG TPA: hypothetical protein VLX28_17590 [Thermoanaerobaculia bacterium]|nr:hypothetical protein [Thermoanaerobaculia bacterium]
MNGFLQSALSSLPSVATSPLAFLGYCLLLAVWLAIALKIKRHHQLLSQLHKLPPKDRIKALQDELSGVKIKSGLTPEQWIRSRRHLYLFWGFLYLCLVLLFLFAIAVTTSPSPGTVATDITLASEKLETPSSGALLPKSDFSASHLKLMYVYDRKGDWVQVRPKMPYLELLANGGPVSGLKADFQWSFPEISVNFVNNTNRTLLLTEVQVTVRASTINKEPLLIFDDESDHSLRITNVGWGQVLDPHIDLGFTREELCARVVPAKMRLSQSITLKSFSRGTSIPVRQTEEGLTRVELGRQVYQINLLQGACAYGRIQYSTEDGTKKSLWFKTRIYLGLTRYEGVLAASSVNALFLEAGKQGYIKRLPISQSMAPGEADHFAIVIGTDKSAHFDLSMDFRSAEGVILKGKSLDIDLFVPSFEDSHHTDVVDIATHSTTLTQPATTDGESVQGASDIDALLRFRKQVNEAASAQRAMEAEIQRQREWMRQQFQPPPSFPPPLPVQPVPPP